MKSDSRHSILHVIPFWITIALIITFAILFNPDPAIADTDSYLSYLSPSLDYLTVVNESHPYEFGGDYDTALQDRLVYLPDVYGEATPVEAATASAFQSLQADLAEKGTIIGLYVGYMTAEDQSASYDYYSSIEDWNNTNTLKQAGYSEHHTGLMLNILIWHKGPEDAVPIWYTETAARQESIPEFAIVHQTLANHGFIDRYPAGKESITGTKCEPFEIRFVGSPEIAHAIMDNNLTLEEYLNITP